MIFDVRAGGRVAITNLESWFLQLACGCAAQVMSVVCGAESDLEWKAGVAEPASPSEFGFITAVHTYYF